MEKICFGLLSQMVYNRLAAGSVRNQMVRAKNYTATPASNRTNLFGTATWASARTAGITEHQTAKIQSAFSGLYYFHARWYDPLVGRFVGRDPGTTLWRGNMRIARKQSNL
ncbi:MAG: hypothetical protein DIKNOCCD_01198 [bacterium]|nr:hypothetical protein [bacterium]